MRDQGARGPQIVGHGGQWLVEFVRQDRGHLAHGIQAPDLGQVSLELVRAPFRRAHGGEVAGRAGDEPPASGAGHGQSQFHGKVRPVTAATVDRPGGAHHAPLAGFDEPADEAVMARSLAFGHQDSSVPADDLVRGPAEQDLGGGTEAHDQAGLVDHHGGVGGRGQGGALDGRPILELCNAAALGGQDAAQLAAGQRDDGSDQQEDCRAAELFRRRQGRPGVGQEGADGQDRRCAHCRRKARHGRAGEHRRQAEQVDVVCEQGAEQQMQRQRRHGAQHRQGLADEEATKRRSAACGAHRSCGPDFEHGRHAPAFRPAF